MLKRISEKLIVIFITLGIIGGIILYFLPSKNVSEQEFREKIKELNSKIDTIKLGIDTIKKDVKIIKLDADTLKKGQHVIFNEIKKDDSFLEKLKNIW